MKSSLKYIIGLLALISFIVYIFYKLDANKKSAAENIAIGSEKTVIYPVTTIMPTMEVLDKATLLNGIFMPIKSLDLTSDIAGRVTTHNLAKGQKIFKGQTIVRVYNEDISTQNQQSTIDRNLALQNIEKAKSDLLKLEDMLAHDAVTKQQVEDQKMIVTNAEAAFHTVSKKSRAITIQAPMSGIVEKSSLEVGSYISPGLSIAQIIDLSSLKIQVAVPAEEVIHLKVGKLVTVVPDVYPQAKLNGKVLYIASQADVSRNFLIEIQVANSSSHPIKAGMTGSVKLSQEAKKSSMTIPTNCLIGSMQNPQIYVVKNGIAMQKNIVVGYTLGDKAEVLQGLSLADSIVATGQLNIVHGAKVNILK
jgi:membrane fusion protein, multidrug efflux system